MKIINIDQIEGVIEPFELIEPIEKGFIAYSSGRAVVPPPGELVFNKPEGVVHLKYGYIEEGDFYVVKIASGFYNNPQSSIATSNGLMMLFSKNTGEPKALLLDEGRLTDYRTATAGAIAAKYLAPKTVKRIGIFGAGIQGREQLRFLRQITPCKDVIVWGVDTKELALYKEEMSLEGYDVEITQHADPIGKTCNLIVTCTPSKKPLISWSDIQAGTHITAVGADTPGKQELDSKIIANADVLVVDSRSQVCERGECQHAFRKGLIKQDELVELGQVISGESPGRASDDQISVVDLTGIATQDLNIAETVYNMLSM